MSLKTPGLPRRTGAPEKCKIAVAVVLFRFSWLSVEQFCFELHRDRKHSRFGPSGMHNSMAGLRKRREYF
jgi:hypothetical protein